MKGEYTVIYMPSSVHSGIEMAVLTMVVPIFQTLAPLPVQSVHFLGHDWLCWTSHMRECESTERGR